MAGELVPLVLLPRYTTYASADTFTSIGMDVTQYSKAIVNVWRGNIIGTSGTDGFTLQESTDQTNWTTCSGTSADFDPGADAEDQYEATLTKRWFRIKVTTTGTNVALSCWAIGFLEMRES